MWLESNTERPVQTGQRTVRPNACLARIKSERRLNSLKMMQNHFKYDNISLTELFVKYIAGLYVS